MARLPLRRESLVARGHREVRIAAGREHVVQSVAASIPDSTLTASSKHRTLAHVLETDAQFTEWTARHRREAALTRSLRKHLPRPIAERVRVTDARGGVLEIAAGAGAIAAALRQRVPDLRSALARDGWDFSEIRVRVQVAGIAEAKRKTATRQWDTNAAAPLFDLGERIADGPLKAALTRWSRRSRGR